MLLFAMFSCDNPPPVEATPPPIMEARPQQQVQIVRFVALGDGGEGNQAQYDVAQAMQTVCTSKFDGRDGCDFALYLGDNIYQAGVSSTDDAQFLSKFEAPYADLAFPFYVVLGNHDYGGCVLGKCGAGFEVDKAAYQVEYSERSEKWTMPSEYYFFEQAHTAFYGLDTNAILWEPWRGTGQEQIRWFEQVRQESQKQWNIAFGHHPYKSNGQHGNAGEYEGLGWLSDLFILDVPAGTAIRDFVQNSICEKVDVYISGHDHNRQWLTPTCGTHFIVSGAAAKLSPIVNHGQEALFVDDKMEGFLWVEITNNCLVGEFYDKTGTLNFEHSFCKE